MILTVVLITVQITVKELEHFIAGVVIVLLEAVAAVLNVAGITGQIVWLDLLLAFIWMVI
ncbi:hypothetical protein C8Q76DRAFT_799409 [Earliella scabrosa]|nr:hypothetical protein C8Q76DRAFT_799409 [Earliella scabrosa]